MEINIVEKTREKFLEYEQRHKNILDAAIRIFNDWGYKAATTAAIAKEAGIPEHTMYQHFKNKKAMFLECNKSIIDQLMAGYRQVYKETKDDEIGYLRGVEKVYREFVINNPQKSKFFFQMYSQKNDPDIGGALNDFIERSIDVVEQMVLNGKKKGRIKSKIKNRELAALFISGYFTTVFVKDYVDSKNLADTYEKYTDDLFGIK